MMKVVYGFALDYAGEHTLPCLGRVLPEAEYDIVFHFPPAGPTYAWLPLCAGVALGLLFPVAWGVRRPRQRAEDSDREGAALPPTVDRTRNELHVEGERIGLAEKEAQVLDLLLGHRGEVVTRDYLTEKIWTAEGVITDRSLDVYISRLRKKLSEYDELRIATVRGKGYVIERPR